MATQTNPQQPPIENAADYVDALLRPQQREQAMKWKFIEGRRMRDKLIGAVIVPDESSANAPG
jgi:hypothetical protein